MISPPAERHSPEFEPQAQPISVSPQGKDGSTTSQNQQNTPLHALGRGFPTHYGPRNNGIRVLRPKAPIDSVTTTIESSNQRITDPLSAASDLAAYDSELAHCYVLPREPTPLLLRPSSEFYPMNLPGYGQMDEYEEEITSKDDQSTVNAEARPATDTVREEEGGIPYTQRFPTEEQYMDSQSGKVWMHALPNFLENRCHQPVLWNYNEPCYHAENVIIQVEKRGEERVFEVSHSPRNLLTVGMILRCHGCLVGGWELEEIFGRDGPHIYTRCSNTTFHETVEIRMKRSYVYQATWVDKIRCMARLMAPCFWD
ncbi:hypothetical protein C8J57DRAFT_1259371 [Mycena rebaudengoi]|nr:hypothetical protein C8J57DRAFT_1259371 [Mycena rebaudengoi]